MNELFLKIINMSISASWLVLAVLILRLILKKAPKWVNVLLWGIVAIRMICPFSFESALSLIPSAETIPLDIEMAAKPTIDSGVPAINSVVNPVLSSFAPPQHVLTSANPLQIWIPILNIIWLVGVGTFLLYTAVSYWRLRRKVDTSVRYKDNIFQSENVGSPFVLGIIKPRIYLPFKMEAQDLEHVVAHEQAHIRRKDHWWKPLGFLLLTIHWFNPLMWLAYVLLCRDIELACDEKVIKELDNEQRADYTQALVACSVNHRMIAACPLAFGEVGVKERVKSVMNYKKPAFWIVILAAIACVGVAVCFLTNPITIGDHFVLTNSESPADTNKLAYDIQLGKQTMSGEIYVEQWIDGTCVQSAPVVMTQYVDSIEISMREHRENGASVGTDIQIETNQYGGSLLTYFAHPENLNITGWAFEGYELGEKIKLSPNKEVILAAKVFDNGSGVRVFDCKTLANEPERLENAAYMIVVRAVFSADPLGATIQEEVSSPAEVLSLNDVIILSQKGYDLTWADFEQYDYVETGSGLYIRVYKINELFELWIGGAGPDSDPMYIYLTLADNLDTKIDIRDGGVTEFISEYGNSKPAYHAEGVLHFGLNAEVIEIDAINHILYVRDIDSHASVFGDRCAIDCTEAIRNYNLLYVNYDAEDDVRTIEFDDFQVGDAVIIGLYDSEKQNALYEDAIAEQVQLATQRMNQPTDIHYPAHKSLYEPTPIEQIDAKYDNEEFVITKLHYENLDGEWVSEGYTYKYRLEITGRMNNAAKNTTYIVLSNTEDITFDQTWKASGLSSNMADYFDPSVAVIVGHKLFS